MSNRPARFTQAELARAARVAKEYGWRIEIVDGAIRLVQETDMPPMSNENEQPPHRPLAKKREILL